jgi:hypothetical protein
LLSSPSRRRGRRLEHEMIPEITTTQLAEKLKTDEKFILRKINRQQT